MKKTNTTELSDGAKKITPNSAVLTGLTSTNHYNGQTNGRTEFVFT